MLRTKLKDEYQETMYSKTTKNLKFYKNVFRIKMGYLGGSGGGGCCCSIFVC